FAPLQVQNLHAGDDVIAFDTDRVGTFRVRRQSMPQPVDAGVPDASQPDAFVPDAFVPDAFVPDSAQPDASQPDAGTPTPVDAGSVIPVDAGPAEEEPSKPEEPSFVAGTGCVCDATRSNGLEAALYLGALLWFGANRRRRT